MIAVIKVCHLWSIQVECMVKFKVKQQMFVDPVGVVARSNSKIETSYHITVY